MKHFLKNRGKRITALVLTAVMCLAALPMYELNGYYLDDERHNLDIQLSRPILVVGDLGLWNGRRMGYKEIESGNISDCLCSERDIDNATWYVDKNGDFRCEAVHHDGTNYYLYRVYKDNVSETQIDNLKEKLYRGTATRADIVRITRRLGDEIAKYTAFRFRASEKLPYKNGKEAKLCRIYPIQGTAPLKPLLPISANITRVI